MNKDLKFEGWISYNVYTKFDLITECFDKTKG